MRPLTILFLALAIGLGATVAPCASPYFDLDPALVDRALQDTILSRNVELTVEEDGPTSVVLTLRNHNQFGEVEGLKYGVLRLLLLPSGGKVKVEPLEFAYRIGDEHDNVFRFKLGDDWPLENGKPIDFAEKVKVTDYGDFRGRRLGKVQIEVADRLEIAPGIAGRFHLDEARFALSYADENGAVPRFEWPRGWSDPEGDAFLAKAVINPGLPLTATEPPQSLSFESSVAWVNLLRKAEKTGPLLRFRVYEPGVYRLTGRMIADAGFEPVAFRANALRLFYEGEELPLAIDAADDVLTPDSDIYFYAPIEPEPEGTVGAVWLLPAARDLLPTPPLRIAPAEVGDGTTVTPSGNAKLTYYTSVFRKVDYERAISAKDGFSRWYWKAIPMGQFAEFEIESGPAQASDLPGKLTVWGAVPRQRYDFGMEVFLNGSTLGQQQYGRSENRKTAVSIRPGGLRAGMNTIAVAVGSDQPRRRNNTLLIKGFELEIPVRLEAPRPGFVVEALATGSPDGPVRVPCAIDSADGLRIWDVTDPRRPAALGLAPGGDGPPLLELNHVKPTRIAFFDRRTAKLVAGLSPRPLPTCLQTGEEGASSLLIYHERFAQGAQRLAKRHRSVDGAATRTVDVDELYDTFSYGRPTHRAIVEALRYAASYWKKPAPMSVTLIGESSEFRGNPAELPVGTMPDFMPVFDFDSAERDIVRGDARYAYVSENGRLPQLAVARLSVHTPEELDALLGKIERYEDEPVTGPWQAVHTFVADDEPVFERAAERIRARELSGTMRPVVLDQNDFPYRLNLRIPGAKFATRATERIVEAIESGTMMMNYFGHGGPNIWSHERLFHLEDVRDLNNGGRLPFITCSSCDNAWLDYPLDPVSESMGELLSRMPNGGAIGVFAPTAGGVTRDHEVLMEALYEGVFRQGFRRLGEAALYARLRYIVSEEQDFLTDQFVLLGDPRTSLAIPRSGGDLVVTPAFVDAERGGRVVVGGQLRAAYWGWADVALKSAITGELIAHGSTRLRSGAFQISFPIEPNQSEGRINIVATVYNEAERFTRELQGGLDIGRPRLRWVTPKHTFGVEGGEGLTRVPLTLDVRNTSPVPVESGSVRVWREQSDRPIFERRYAFEPGEERTIPFEYPAAVGIHSLRVELTALDDEPATEYPVTLVVYDPEAEPTYALQTSMLRDVPAVLDQPVTFSAELFNVGQSVDLAGGDPPTVEITAVDTGSTTNLSAPLTLTAPRMGEFITGNITIPAEAWASARELRLAAIPRPYDETRSRGPRPATEAIELQSRRGPDLSVDPNSLRIVSENFQQGETLFVRGRVTNEGDQATGPFLVALYLDEPWVNKNEVGTDGMQRDRRQESLAPGESRTVQLRWDDSLKVGDLAVYFVANSDRRVPERDFTNNETFGRVRIRAFSDLRWEGDIASDRDWAERGQRIQLRATAVCDGEFDAEHVAVRAWIGNDSHADTPSEDAGKRVDLKAGERLPVDFELTVPQHANGLELEINAGHRSDDSDLEDNLLKLPLLVPISPAELKWSDDGGEANWAPILPYGHSIDTRVRPDGAIAPTPDALLDVNEARFTPDFANLVTPPRVDADPASDNQWSLEPGRLEAQPTENAEPILLAIPAGTGRKGLHFVRIRMQAGPDYRGNPAGGVRLRIENDPDFRSYDFSKEVTTTTTRLFDLGTFDLVDGIFDVLVDDPEEAVWSSIVGFEFAPVEGLYESPALDMRELRRRTGATNARLMARPFLPAGSEMRFSWRAARLLDNGRLEWSEWTDDDSNDLATSGVPIDLAPWDALVWRWHVSFTPESEVRLEDVRLLIDPPASVSR